MKNKDIKITSARFYEAELNRTNDGINIQLPFDVIRHLKIQARDGQPAKIHFVATGNCIQICNEIPSVDIPLFCPEEFEQVK